MHAIFFESEENTCIVTLDLAMKIRLKFKYANELNAMLIPCSLSETSRTAFYHSLLSQSKMCILPALVAKESQLPSGE